ncbi:hypothetical protein [Pseudomonas sp. KK4]|uniref:hypothetical protein n=1 Tax=Pseudomonas sp. KK4 TaxID=1855729 RepID=UPI001115559D|nr:hypothetical protein [Pseudomonas sp. KK4]
MQYGLIFESAVVANNIALLNGEDKVLLGGAYLYRQKRLIEDFDKLYGEKLSSLFKAGILACLEGRVKALAHLKEVEDNIPDTEEFGEQEGAYAQNLLIALLYLIKFSTGEQFEDFERSVSLAIDNIDLVNYEKDESYDEEAVTQEEIAILIDMIDKLVKRVGGGKRY